MVAMGSPRFTRSLVSTLHAAPLCRLQTELGDSLLFERLAASSRLQASSTATDGVHASEHCPACRLQVHGRGELPELALSVK